MIDKQKRHDTKKSCDAMFHGFIGGFVPQFPDEIDDAPAGTVGCESVRGWQECHTQSKETE